MSLSLNPKCPLLQVASVFALVLCHFDYTISRSRTRSFVTLQKLWRRQRTRKIIAGCTAATNGPTNIYTSAVVGTWVQSSYTFNTGANNSITIALVDNTTTAGGNDFGLDTITLAVGYIEACKASSTTNPLTSQDPTTYSFTVMGTSFTSANPLMVPVGECSGPISVPTGTATIMDLPTPGVAVSTITTDGYSPQPLSQQEGNALLVSSDTQTGTATVLVYPASAGDTSAENIVTYTNYPAPPGQLKLCKIAGNTNITPGTPFVFTLPAEGGYCVVLLGTFQVRTSVPIAESLPGTGYSMPAVTVNGANTTLN